MTRISVGPAILLKMSRREAEELAQWLTLVLAEDLSLLPSNHARG